MSELRNKFTEEDLDNCWTAYKDYFLEVLNGEYPLEEAREDLRSLIGTKWDARAKKPEIWEVP